VSRADPAEAPARDVPAREVAAHLRAAIVRALNAVPVIAGPLKALRAALSLPARLLRELVFVARSIGRLRGVSMLVVSGGGQLGDYFGGVWGYPYYIFRWTILARMTGAKVVFLSVGAGPIRSRASGLLFRAALSLASYRSFRDEGSRQLVEETTGIRDNNRLVPDLVLGLDGAALPAAPISGSSLTIAINPIPYFDVRYWAESVATTYERHVTTIAEFAAWVLKAGHRVVLFPTQLNADPPVIEDVKRLLPPLSVWEQARLLDRPVRDFESLLGVLTSADVVVTGRYHGQILALVSGKPVIGLAYNDKTPDLLRGVGQEPYALDIATTDLPTLTERFERLLDEVESVRAVISRRLSDHRRLIEAQYDMLFGTRAAPQLPALSRL
jgi:polysaccharide pyruvyl transferase WcaK-like protein